MYDGECYCRQLECRRQRRIQRRQRLEPGCARRRAEFPDGLHADIGGVGVTKGSGAFTVASSGLATVNSLDIGAANATLALTGGTFTVDNIQSGVGGVSIAVDLGAINVSASATLAFGTIADSAVPLANGADNYAYSGELLDTGGALNIAAGGALQIDEPRFKFLSNGKAGVVTLAGDAVIQGATTIGDTLENVNNLIQGAGTIGNGAGSGSAVEGGLVLQNDAAGVIDANAATAMTIDTGAEKDENSGLIETTGAGGLIIDSDIAQNGLLIAAGTGAISINDAHVGGNRGNDIVQSGGRIVLNGSQLTTGGTISVAAGGTITTVAGADDNLGVASNNAGVGDDLSSGAIENSGTIEIANGTTLNLDGSVYNNGAGSRIWLDGATSATTLEIYGGGAAIYGAGALVMSNSENTHARLRLSIFHQRFCHCFAHHWRLRFPFVGGDEPVLTSPTRFNFGGLRIGKSVHTSWNTMKTTSFKNVRSRLFSSPSG